MIEILAPLKALTKQLFQSNQDFVQYISKDCIQKIVYWYNIKSKIWPKSVQEHLYFLSYFQGCKGKGEVAKVDFFDIQDHYFSTSSMLVSFSFQTFLKPFSYVFPIICSPN